MTSILNPIARPIAWVLAAFYSIIPNFGVAIIGLSLAWMILIAPLTLKSTRSMLAMQALQPEIKRLQDKHRNDKQAFAQAQMELFRERKVSPLSSCLPSLLPLPVFIALFRVIDGLSHTTVINGVKTATPKYLNMHTAMYHGIVNAHGKINAFGLNLADNAFSHHSSALSAAPFFILLLIMIGTSYLQTAMMMNRNPAASQNPQMKYMKYLPLVFGIICVRFPAGVVLYYAVSNMCRIAQQYAMYRWDPRVRALISDEVRDVEARTRDIDRSQGVVVDDDDAPAPAPRLSFRELLSQNRNPPPADSTSGTPRSKPPGTGSTSGPKDRPRTAPNDRPGSVKANRNRNGGGTAAGRGRSTTGSGGSVKGSGGAAGSARRSPPNDRSSTNGKNTAAGNGKATPPRSGTSANGNGGASTNGAANNGRSGGPVDPKATNGRVAKTNGSKPTAATPNSSRANGNNPKGSNGAGTGGRSGGAGAPPPKTRRRRGR